MALALRITPNVVDVAPDGTLLPGCPRFTMLNALVASARKLSLTCPGSWNAREIAMTASGGLGEQEGGGPALNVLPKEGGNSLHGTFFINGATEGMIGSNYTQELKDRGLTTPGETRKVWDFNLGIGGPIKRDRLWYYLNLREEGSERTVPGMFANKNAGDPNKWTYEADTTRPAVLAASYRITALRLTAQATPRNQFKVFWDQQRPCEGGQPFRPATHRGSSG